MKTISLLLEYPVDTLTLRLFNLSKWLFVGFGTSFEGTFKDVFLIFVEYPFAIENPSNKNKLISIDKYKN